VTCDDALKINPVTRTVRALSHVCRLIIRLDGGQVPERQLGDAWCASAVRAFGHPPPVKPD